MSDKKLLLVQFRDDISAEHEVSCFMSKVSLRQDLLTVKNAINENINDYKDFDAVIFGGSGQYDLSTKVPAVSRALEHTTDLFKFIFKNDIPTLGVCFGMQLICETLGGVVIPEPTLAESGTVEISLNSIGINDKLLANIPSIFYAQESHKECVVTMGAGSTLLGSSSTCANQIVKYKNNIYGVQFHPELLPEDIAYRWGLYPEYLKGKDINQMKASLINTPDAARILKNFVEIYLSK